MNMKKGIWGIILGMLFLIGCDESLKWQQQEEISEGLVQLAEGYRNIYEEMDDAQSLNILSDIERIVAYISQQGYAVVDEENQLDMQHYEKVESFCRKASEGKTATTGMIVVRNNGGLHYYGLSAANGDLMITETVLSWESDGPVISYTHSYEAFSWKYTENGYLFFEEYYPEGYDGAPAQVGIRILPLNQTCRELNRKYVLPVGYEGNNMLITDWTESDFSELDIYDIYESFYQIKYHKKVLYEELVTCVEYEIPENEFEEVLQTFLSIEDSAIKQYTNYNDTTESYQYHPRTMYDAIMAYGPYPEVIDYEELSDGRIRLIVQGVWTRKMNDNVWQSELVVRPLKNGGFQYVSNHVKDAKGKEAAWYTPRLLDAEWKIYAKQESDSLEDMESGYDLPISDQAKEAAQADCLAAMRLIKEIYLHADKGTAANAVITRDTAAQMVQKLAENGKISMANGYHLNMENHEAADQFLTHAQSGQEGTTTVYNIHSGGGIERKEFTFDGTNMYLLSTTAAWNTKGKEVVNHTIYSRLESWQYTEKGWLIYEYSLPKMSDRINGNDMFRIKPLEESLREICEKYLIPIGYMGNNLLCSNWSADDMENLDYNGLFQYFYEIEHGVTFTNDQCKAGIPKEEFENLLTKYLPVSKEQIQSYAVYDAKKEAYVWRSLGQMSYKINFFATSFPEVTSMRENMDGTMTLAVDAVCNLMGKDAVIRHELTVQFLEEGGIRYLSNQILENGLDMIPEYQYRVK